MKKLRRRMILAVGLIITVVFLIVLGAVMAALSIHNRAQAESTVELIKLNGGNMPSKKEYDLNVSEWNFDRSIEMDAETVFRTRYFTVHLDSSGEITDTDMTHIAAIDQSTADEMTETVEDMEKTSGYLGEYYFKVSEEDDGTMIIFLDCSSEYRSLILVLEVIGGIMIFLIIVVTTLFGVFSGKIILPFEENSRLQKQFITDASHELKTPLAVISANADVMKYKYGTSPWLDNISDQTKQMSQLIGDLLALTKADEVGTDFVREPVDLVPLVEDTWGTFRENAQEKGVTMTTDLPETLPIDGNKAMLTKLLSVLSENAAKYVKEGGEMQLSARSTSRKITLRMYNTADLPEDTDYAHLFERFYRPDSSRTSSTGGHGIGLSIARRIVDNHRGTITAAKEKDGICFTVTLPRKS